jgi:hypothetical protein
LISTRQWISVESDRAGLFWPDFGLGQQTEEAHTMKTIYVILMLSLCYPTYAFELATKITQTANTAKLETTGYAKVNLLQETITLKGSIAATGTLNVKGRANIVMWSKVDGAYYFSKLPQLQNIKDTANLNFTIPFNSGDKSVTKVVIEVEMLTEGSVSIGGFSVSGV